MSQNAESADDDSIYVTYSTLPSGKRSSNPLAALLDFAGPGAGPVQASRGAWPCLYHRILDVAFLGAVLALGMLLGTLVSGQAAFFRSMPLPLRLGVNTTLTTQSGAVGSVSVTADAVDARFAIVTLGIRCLLDPCDATHYVPAGQRVYARRGGWSCTTMSSAEVVDQREQYVYCRLDQPNVFTSTFDGAQFDCVGSRLGCRFAVQVETTNAR